MRSGSADPPADKPRYVQLRKGRWYWEPPARLRHAYQLDCRPLGADQGRAWEMAREFNRRLDALPATAGQPGSVRWLFDRFLESDKFHRLAPSTQGDYRWLATRLSSLQIGGQLLGALAARAITPRRADGLHALLQQTSGNSVAHYACRFARRVWKWGARQEHVPGDVPNPWSGMELPGIPQREQVWTAAQVAAVKAKAGELGVPSIALAVSLAYWLAHRQGDVLSLTWTALDAGRRRTGKTKAVAVLVATAYPELAAELAAERERQARLTMPSTHVLICETTGRPWRADFFRHVFRKVANAAGLPSELQFRDLRATAATELSDAGADVIDLSTHTTHRTMQMARRYSRPTKAQFERAAEKRLKARKNTD